MGLSFQRLAGSLSLERNLTSCSSSLTENQYLTLAQASCSDRQAGYRLTRLFIRLLEEEFAANAAILRVGLLWRGPVAAGLSSICNQSNHDKRN